MSENSTWSEARQFIFFCLSQRKKTNSQSHPAHIQIFINWISSEVQTHFFGIDFYLAWPKVTVLCTNKFAIIYLDQKDGNFLKVRQMINDKWRNETITHFNRDRKSWTCSEILPQFMVSFSNIETKFGEFRNWLKRCWKCELLILIFWLVSQVIFGTLIESIWLTIN